MMKYLLFSLSALLLALPSHAEAPPEEQKGFEILFSPTGPKRLIQARLEKQIGSARKQIVLAMYQFTSDQLAKALVKAHKKGIDVRVLLDARQIASSGIYARARETLEKGKVPIRLVYPDGVENKRSRKSRASLPKWHHKFCVFDKVIVATGSYNWTVLADEDSHENLMLIGDKRAAGQFASRFEEIWKDHTLTESLEESGK
ncbi:MAG: phospholipase D-like domain-containing protein [Planctomycetota bacterium]|nr:phospholipase D-like domain-containing protein [Planctomycetota bacterium]